MADKPLTSVDPRLDSLSAACAPSHDYYLLHPDGVMLTSCGTQLAQDDYSPGHFLYLRESLKKKKKERKRCMETAGDGRDSQVQMHYLSGLRGQINE